MGKGFFRNVVFCNTLKAFGIGVSRWGLGGFHDWAMFSEGCRSEHEQQGVLDLWKPVKAYETLNCAGRGFVT
jgi:hypothetical protein